jgi:hypothetical protein
MPDKLTSADAGCLIDGHHGWHAHAIMIRLAESYGYQLTAPVSVIVAAYERTGDGMYVDVVTDVMDSAEAWLNEHVAPDGYSFGWHDGEFFLQSVEWWQEDV